MAKKGNKAPKPNYSKQERQRQREQERQMPASTTATAPATPRPNPAQTPTPSRPAGTGAQTLQQQRAKYALEKVQAAVDDPDIDNKELKSYASGLPAMIQMNGLGQAAAFHLSQGGTHKVLYDILSTWLTRTGQPYAAHPDLLAGIVAEDMHRYRVAQAEALVMLDWVKKFAKAYVREA